MAKHNQGRTHEGNRKAGSADARSFKSFDGIGGKADGYSKPSKGVGSGGGKAYHSAPKSSENKSPPNARDFDKGFSNKGPKSTNEY